VPVALGWHTEPPPEALVGVDAVHVPADGVTAGLASLAKRVGKNMEDLGRLMGAPLG
jgi:hypothetical protein